MRAAKIFFGSKLLDTFFCRQLDVDTDTVGIAPGFLDEMLRSLGDCLEMDVTAKIVFLPEELGDADHEFHRVISITDDPAAEKEPFDVIPFVEIEGELYDLLRRETSSADIR